jgi:hypothetical protein
MRVCESHAAEAINLEVLCAHLWHFEKLILLFLARGGLSWQLVARSRPQLHNVRASHAPANRGDRTRKLRAHSAYC